MKNRLIQKSAVPYLPNLLDEFHQETIQQMMYQSRLLLLQIAVSVAVACIGWILTHLPANFPLTITGILFIAALLSSGLLCLYQYLKKR